LADATRRRWPALDIVFHTRTTAEDAAGFLSALLDDYSPTAITESIEPTDTAVAHTWRVFFTSADMREQAIDGIAATSWPLTTTKVDVEDEGWAEKSQAALTSVQVDRIIVAPPWDVPSAEASSASGDDAVHPQVIIIEPSMGFGTGHHQSTRLCLRALQRIDLAGARVLDLGTGSGVLGIAAAQLGAQWVLAIDEDPDAVEAARKNVALNDVGPTVDVRQEDLAVLSPQQADVLLANLTGAMLRRHADLIVRHLAPGGRAIVSGFTQEEQLSVAHAFGTLTTELEEQEDGWVSLTFRSAQTDARAAT
jgi:ribosomal protein L11 methyltransferase